MNLLEMIKNEKVEWRKLGELAIISGAGVDKKIIQGERKIKLLNYMDVYKNRYIDNQISNMIVTASEKKIETCTAERGDIFITPSSETVEDILRSAVVLENLEETVYSYHIMRIRLIQKNYITSCFINYLFSEENYRKRIYKLVNGNIRKTITKKAIEELQIPIPSLETQEKIVKILDKFEKYVTELQAELQAELQYRTRHYEYYRDMLLSESYLNKEIFKRYTLKLDKVSLGEIGKVLMCKRILKEQTNTVSGVPFYKIGTFGKKADSYISKELFEEYKNKYSYPQKGEILISASGTIGRTVIFDGEEAYFQDSNIVWLRNNEKKVLNKYLYYFYQTNPWRVTTGGSISRIYTSDIEKIKIVLPPLFIQERIVYFLDNFEKVCKDLNIGLPKEIELRQKQYEYFKEKLLTFETPNLYTPSEAIAKYGEAFAKIYAYIFGMEIKKLGNFSLVTKLAGYEFSKYVNYSEKGKIIAIRGLNVKKGKLILNDIKYIDNSDFSKLNRSKLIKNDILFTYVGTVGEVCIIEENDKYYLAPNVSLIRIKDKNIMPKYLMYYMQSRQFRSKQIEKYLEASSMKNLTMEKIRNFELLIPPLYIQEHIVLILDKLDTLVNSLKEGLPKEIELRQKQYEYYREKLLDFKK